MDIAKLNARRNWLTVFFLGVIAPTLYAIIAINQGVPSTTLDWVFWVDVVSFFGYMIVIAMLAHQLNKNPIVWIIGLLFVSVIAFLYMYPRMMLYISSAKKKAAIGEPSFARQ